MPLAIVPIWDVDLMAAEIHRVAEKGCRAVTFSENPNKLGYPSFHTDHWDPFLRACEETGTVVCLHIGSSSSISVTSDDAPIDVMITTTPVNLFMCAADLIWSQIFRKFPNLKIALSEGGIGWIPYFLDRIDFTYQHHKAWTHQDFGDKLPSQVFHEHIITCFIDDPTGLKLIDDVGLDMVTWECDYPHSDSAWPTAPEVFMKSIGNLSDDAINKITHENAMREFQFDPFAHRPKEQCTVGALRAESADVDVVTRSPRKKESNTDISSFVEHGLEGAAERLTAARHGLGLDDQVVSRPVIDDAKTLWELLERRADGVARRADAHRRGGPHGQLRRVPRRGASGSPPASWRSASRPTRRWRGSCRPASSRSCCRSRWRASARRRSRSSRSTGNARSARCSRRRGVQVLRRARHMAQLRLRGDGPQGLQESSGGAVRDAARHRRSSGRTGLPEGDPSTLPAPPDRRRRRPLALLHVGHHCGAQVREALRRRADRRWPGPGATRSRSEPDDVGSIAFPCTHIGGPDYLVVMLAYGMPAVLLETFDPASAVATFARHDVTMAGGSTAFYLAFLNEQRKDPSKPVIPSLRHAERRWRTEAARGVPRGAGRDAHPGLPRLRHDRVPDDHAGLTQSTTTSSS